MFEWAAFKSQCCHNVLLLASSGIPFTFSLRLLLITKTRTDLNATKCDGGTGPVPVLAAWILSFEFPSVVALALWRN